MIEYPQKLTSIPPNFCSIKDYEEAAKKALPHPIWEYISSGSADETTLQNNLRVFQGIRLWNRVLKDLTNGNTKTRFLNQDFNHPILLGPVAHQKLVDPDGELATAQAADATDTCMVVSTLASHTLEDIASQGQARLWFQLYWQSTRERSLELVWRAEEAGYQALVVTVDAPINGLRRRIQRTGFSVPPEAASANTTAENIQFKIQTHESEIFQGWMSQAPTWEDIAWLIKQTKLPVVLKGILNPLDAEKAESLGAQAIVLSNHGGRSLDNTPSPLEVLPYIRANLGHEFPLLLDGGVRQGSDVFKALALGANAVFIGRPQLYGLTVAGALGVAHLIQTLKQELEVTMALAGCASLKDINKECLFESTLYK